MNDDELSLADVLALVEAELKASIRNVLGELEAFEDRRVGPTERDLRRRLTDLHRLVAHVQFWHTVAGP